VYNDLLQPFTHHKSKQRSLKNCRYLVTISNIENIRTLNPKQPSFSVASIKAWQTGQSQKDKEYSFCNFSHVRSMC